MDDREERETGTMRLQKEQPNHVLPGRVASFPFLAPLLVLSLLLILPYARGASAQPSPPDQPAGGPGGYMYAHQSVNILGPYFEFWHPDEEAYMYYTFEPADPKPDEAPVILFLHGYQAALPTSYAYWMGHMARKGYIVVWVNFDHGLSPPWEYASFAEQNWTDALRRLDDYTWEGHVEPEKDEHGEYKTAIVGHSAGGYLAAIVAAHSTDPDSGIPVPRALVCIEPGGLDLIPAADFSQIDASTKLVLLVGDEDEIVCKSTAQYIWAQTPQIPDANRDFLVYASDRYGEPEQIANHFFPNTTGFEDTAATDARDYYITFKLSTGLLDCVFRGTHCEFAIGNGSPEQLFMGLWSDGRANNPLVWVEDPSQLQTTCLDGQIDIFWGSNQAQAAERFGTGSARLGNRFSALLLPASLLFLVIARHRRLAGRSLRKSAQE